MLKTENECEEIEVYVITAEMAKKEREDFKYFRVSDQMRHSNA